METRCNTNQAGLSAVAEGCNFMPMMNAGQLAALQKKTKLAFIPISPTEVHSTHLPLMTDIVSCLEETFRTARKLKERGIESLIASPINYTTANQTMCFFGNTTLRDETVIALLEDVSLCLAKWGFTDIMIVTGHGTGSHKRLMAQACERVRAQDPRVRISYSNWLPCGLERAFPIHKCAHPELDVHAGEHETGLMLLRFPQLVDMEQLSKLEPNWGAKDWDLDTGYMDKYAPKAYFGDPRLGDAETADRICDICADYIVEEVLALTGQSS